MIIIIILLFLYVIILIFYNVALIIIVTVTMCFDFSPHVLPLHITWYYYCDCIIVLTAHYIFTALKVRPGTYI